ncbi:MAG: cyclic nucleotide-binding domain-containing protein [Pseudomonadota bacterium]|nr:cyclic nucleotide-binding domain-containing protein [Pseudomonadota bacterium]
MRRALYILGQLSDHDVDWLTKVGERVRFDAGDLVIQEGARLDRVFVVLDGQFAVAIRSKEIARLGAGDILGEISMVDHRPASASVRAMSRSLTLAVPRAAMQARLESDPIFAAHFYKAIAIFLADRMRNTLVRFGYGDSVPEELEDSEDELDANVLNTLHLAGARFERLLKKLTG